jgi:hypothetical protein
VCDSQVCAQRCALPKSPIRHTQVYRERGHRRLSDDVPEKVRELHVGYTMAVEMIIDQ